MLRVLALLAAVDASILNGADAMQLPSVKNADPEGTAVQLPILDKFQLVDDPFTVQFQPRGDMFRPRMLAMRGCSGSSAIMVYARNLLRYHGVPVPAATEPNIVNGEALPPIDRGLPSELLNPKINWLYKEAGNDMGKAIEMQNELIRRKGQTLFFKGMVQHLQGTDKATDEWDSLAEPLKKLELFAVLGARENMLDQVICQVKDCFQEDYGTPVDQDGKDSDLCFHRRSEENPTPIGNDDDKQLLLSRRRQQLENVINGSASDDQWFRPLLIKSLFYMDDGYKAKLNVESVVHNIKDEFSKIEHAQEMLSGIGIDVRTVKEEDLLDFQAPIAGAFKRAVAAWSEFLVSLGVNPDEDVIRSFLTQYAGTYHEPPPHKDLISNYDEVRAEIKKSKYAHMLRE